MRFLFLMLLCALLAAPRPARAAVGAGDVFAPRAAQPETLHAPEWSDIVPGARVRVRSPSLGARAVAGRVVQLIGDTLRFSPDGGGGIVTRAVLDERTRVQLSTSHSTYLGRGVLIGGFGGGGIGALIVGTQQAANDFGEGVQAIFGPPPEHHQVSSAPIFVGLGIGVLVGGLVGNAMHQDTWVPVSRPAAVSFGGSFDPSGQPRLTLTISLLPGRSTASGPRGDDGSAGPGSDRK